MACLPLEFQPFYDFGKKCNSNQDCYGIGLECTNNICDLSKTREPHEFVVIPKNNGDKNIPQKVSYRIEPKDDDNNMIYWILFILIILVVLFFIYKNRTSTKKK